MLSVSELLLRYHVPGVREAEVRRICAEEITSVIGYIPNAKQLQYKNEYLFLRVPPIIKSALTLKHKELAARLAARGITLAAVK